MACIKQVITWIILIMSVKLFERVDGQIRLENRIQRRYGSRNPNQASRQPNGSPPLWLSGSQVAPQMHQQPKYLDISLDLLGQQSSQLLFPDPIRINDQQKLSTEYVSSKLPPPNLLPPENIPYPNPAKHPIPYGTRHEGRYTSLFQAAEAAVAASNTYHVTAQAKKPYPYQAQSPLFISYPTYGVSYQQEKQQPSTSYDPMMNHHHYNYNNNHLTAASSSSHYSLNNPLGLSSCCNGNQWKPLDYVLSYTQSPLTSSPIPQVISDPMLTVSSSKPQMSLYLPVKMYDVVAESQRVTKMIPSADHPSNSTPPTTLYIPVPKEITTIIESQHNDTNMNDTLHDELNSDVTTSGLFDNNVALTTTATLDVATVKPNEEKPQTATATTIKHTTPTRNPTTMKATTAKPKATTAKDTEKETTTSKPKTKPPAEDQPVTASSQVAADDIPQRPSVQQPRPRPISPVDDSQFESSPFDDPILEGVPGDLPEFEDVPADAPAAEGGESPLPGLFSEFLNQVADMIEEFQPTTELPLVDDAQGLADGSVADDFAGASDAAQDSILSGSDADGNFESLGDGGGQDGGDFGQPFDNFEGGPGANDNFGNGPGANDNFGGGQPESLPSANNPIATSVQPGASAGTVGEQSAQSLANPVSVAGNKTNQNPTDPSDVAYAPSADQNKPALNPTLPTAAAQTSGVSNPYPSVPINSPNYDPVPIASQPQIHPPATDYVDPGVYNSFPSVPLPQIGATLNSNGALGLNNKLQGPEMFPNRVHDENPSYNNEFPHSDYGEYHVEATTIFEHFAMPDEYPPPSGGNPHPYGLSVHNNELSSQMTSNNDTMLDYDGYSNNDTYIEEQPILPVSNHLGNPSLQPWNGPTSSPGYSNMLTSTTEIPFHTSTVSHEHSKEDTNAPYNKVDVNSPEENHLGSGVSSTMPPMDVDDEQTVQIMNSPPPLAFATPTTAPDTTIREYASSSDKTNTNEWSNHVDDYRPENAQPISVEYSEGDVPDAEEIPADIIPEIQANINIDLLKTANLAKG